LIPDDPRDEASAGAAGGPRTPPAAAGAPAAAGRAPAAAAAAAGERLIAGRYRVERRLGGGGMAEVFLAEDTTLGRLVAVKVLRERFADDEQFVARFHREARAAAALNHPNVVAIHDRGGSAGTSYIVMEYVPGETVKERVQRTGPLSPLAARDVELGLLAALQAAHERGIVHRDVTAQNVLLTGDGLVKVADFGIAHFGASALTSTGMVMGTSRYLSPEQARGGPTDGRSDLYAAGVVLFEMLTGRLPFDGDNDFAIAAQHAYEQAPAPSDFAGELPPELDAIVVRALRKDPAERFQSAAEFAAALTAVDVGAAGGAAVAEPRIFDARDGDPGSADLREADDGEAAAPAPARVVAAAGAVAAGTAATGVAAAAAATIVAPAASTAATQVVAPGAHGVGADPRHARIDGDGSTMRRAHAGDGESSTRRRRRRVALLVCLVVLAAAIAGVVAYRVYASRALAVPAVVGMGARQAAHVLRDKGFSVGSTGGYSDAVVPGAVMAQKPAAGAALKKGQRVRLVVSRGLLHPAVASVVGKTSSEAAAALRAEMFVPRALSQHSPAVAPGLVIRQRPAAGSPLLRGSRVRYWVSSGPPKVSVPDVVGAGEGGATDTLKAAGFSVVVDTTVGFGHFPGDVVKQDPSAGSRALQGSQVTIWVALL
jgi:beta-lactam-binding protein with PASTA domain